MRRTRVMMILAGAAASCAVSLAMTAGPALGAAAQAGTWGKAIQVPGLAGLSAGHGGILVAVSCSSPGNCAATGNYTDRLDHSQAFVVSEKSGSWGNAIEVPRLAALNTGDNAQVASLSCGSAGNCAAGGFYTNGSDRTRAFVVSEKNGSWGKAIQVPGASALSGVTGGSSVASVSCGSAGNCVAGGQYFSDGEQQAFVVSETNGSWGTAIEVPGSAALDAGNAGGIDAVSCASVGNCAAVGSYRNADGVPLAFVVNESDGSWGNAIEVPGSATFGTDTFDSVSCASAGNCAAAGFSGSDTTDASFGPLVVSEKNGTWGKAIEVPGTTPDSRNAALTVSCGSPGNCLTGGNKAPSIEGPYQGFVSPEKNGSWRTAAALPGLAALNVGGSASVLSVSCESAGNCSAGGNYEDGSSHQQAFVVSEDNGSWGTAIEVPGSGALNTGGSAQVSSVSCTSGGYCVAAGYYADSAIGGGAFLSVRS
jgi:hypothetical protein